MSQLVGHGRAQTQTSIDMHSNNNFSRKSVHSLWLILRLFLWLNGQYYEIFYFGVFWSISFTRYPTLLKPDEAEHYATLAWSR
jgi:hypothetical protein